MDALTLPEIGEKFLIDPALLKLAGEEWEFDDDFAVKCAWGAHGYDTGMEPFFSAEQLKAAMTAAWTASRAAALEEAAAACNGVLDMKEEAKALKASEDARGTPDELARLKHWATVSTFNAGIRRCISAIRSLRAADEGKQGK